MGLCIRIAAVDAVTLRIQATTDMEPRACLHRGGEPVFLNSMVYMGLGVGLPQARKATEFPFDAVVVAAPILEYLAQSIAADLVELRLSLHDVDGKGQAAGCQRRIDVFLLLVEPLLCGGAIGDAA